MRLEVPSKALLPWHRRREGGEMAGPHGRAAYQAKGVPTVAASVRRFCLECLGAASARNAYDCLSQICPLYVCTPFRGKPMPKHLAAGGDVAEAEASRGQETARPPKTRSSKARVAAYCRHCQPGDRTDCQAEDCALYPWRPWQPGGQPKLRTMTRSQKRRLRVVGHSSQFESSRQ